MNTAETRVQGVGQEAALRHRLASTPSKRKRGARKMVLAVLKQIVLLILVAPVAIVFLMPWAWMLSTAGKDMATLWAIPPVWLPRPYLWQNYAIAWEMGKFAIYFRNTAYMTSMNVIGNVVSSVVAAYAFARLRFKGRDILFIIVLATMMLPSQVTLIPLYVIFSKMRWTNSFKPLVIPGFFGDAFSIFLLRQFFMTISREYDDAAYIDGCSHFGVLFRILLPQIRPAVAVVAIFVFTWAWNNYMGPLIYLSSPDLFPVTLGLQRFIGRANINIQYLMAMTAVATLIPVFIFFAAQRYFIQGIVISGVKG